MKLAVALCCAVALAACKSETAAGPSPAEASKQADGWTAVINAPDRAEADKKRDAGRHPEQMLEFLDPKPGMRVADLGAAGGYTTELLARAVGPTGKVYMQNDPEWANGFLKQGLAERFARPAMKDVVRVDRPFDDPLPPEANNLDLVVFNAIYHDVVNSKQDRAKMNQGVFNALKPGGVYVVIDSSAKPGSGLTATDTLHRIDEQVVRDEVMKAGFKLQSESQFLRNPQDTRDWSASPRNAGERLGTSDRFALRFVRP